MGNELVKWTQAQSELSRNITVKQLPFVKTALKIADAAIEELKARKDFISMRQVDMDRIWLVWRAGKTVKKVQVGHGDVAIFKRDNRDILTSGELGINETDAWRWKMVACIPKNELDKKLMKWKVTERIGLNPFVRCGRSLAQKITIHETDQESWQVTDDQKIVPCAVVITDPPYGILSEDWEPDKLESFTREWLTRWNESKADFILSFWSQRYLFDGKVWFDESLSNYDFTQLLIWHYPNNKSPQSRKMFKQTWEPILFYRNRGTDREVKVGGDFWGDRLNDFDCNIAAVPQSNFNDENQKVHPAQKPVSIMRWLICATTRPGEIVCDPFCGSGTTGIAALQLQRGFHGIETNEEYVKLARARINNYGNIRKS